MKTTNLFVELVVVGTGAALFVALLFYTFFGDRLLFGQPLSSLAKPDDLASIIPVLSFIYVLGIVIDKIAYRIFKGKEDCLRKKNFEEFGDDGYYKKRHSLYTSANMTQAVEAFEYGRSKVRICRGWTVNSVLLILVLICFMIFRHGFDSMIVVGIVALGLLAYLTSLSWKVATDVEHRWLERFPPDKLKVEFFHGEEDPPLVFIVINKEDQPIEGFKMTTYPPAVGGSTLLQEFSFYKEIGAIEKGGSVSVTPNDLKNEKGERLSDSKKKVGVVHLMGKVGGQAKGIMMPISK